MNIAHSTCVSCHAKFLWKGITVKAYLFCFYSNFLYSWLYVYMYVSCFHSYSSLFLFVCIHVYNVMAFLYTLIPVYFFFISFLFFVTFIFWDALFRSYLFQSLLLTCLIVYCYWFNTRLIKFQYEESLQQTINQQTPNMKRNQWRRVRVAWI